MEKDAVFWCFRLSRWNAGNAETRAIDDAAASSQSVEQSFYLAAVTVSCRARQREHVSMAEQIRATYRYCFGRMPDEQEESEAASFVRQYGWTAHGQSSSECERVCFCSLAGDGRCTQNEMPCWTVGDSWVTPRWVE